jgi:hypothetical protein
VDYIDPAAHGSKTLLPPPNNDNSNPLLGLNFQVDKPSTTLLLRLQASLTRTTASSSTITLRAGLLSFSTAGSQVNSTLQVSFRCCASSSVSPPFSAASLPFQSQVWLHISALSLPARLRLLPSNRSFPSNIFLVTQQTLRTYHHITCPYLPLSFTSIFPPHLFDTTSQS